MVSKTENNAPVVKALMLLEEILAFPSPPSVNELSLRTGLPGSTVHRFCKLLCDSGYVYKDPVSRTFGVGIRSSHLAQQIFSNQTLLAPRRALLENLAKQTGETCNITVLTGTKITYLDRVETHWPHRITLDVGSQLPLHCSSSGKLFLAYMRKNQRQVLLNQYSLDKHTDKTLTDVAQLNNHLKNCRQQKLGINDEEYMVGLVAIATPLLDQNGRLFATLSVQAPTTRYNIDKLINEHHQKLLDHGTQLCEIFDHNRENVMQNGEAVQSILTDEPTSLNYKYGL